ncbi:hypothetical protein Tco_0077545 [Tanacetum coccineum]
MGILSWWKGSSSNNNKSNTSLKTTTDNSKAMVSSEKLGEEIPGMNGAVEVSRPSAPNVDVTVFEFGSVAASSDKVTLAGYCPVSDDLEPCRWEILPASGSDAPQFRVEDELVYSSYTALFTTPVGVILYGLSAFEYAVLMTIVV